MTKWKGESYTPSPHEQCCSCGEPLGKTGAHYWGLLRICLKCYRARLDEQANELGAEAYSQLRQFVRLAQLFRVACWWAIGLSSCAIAACVASLIIK